MVEVKDCIVIDNQEYVCFNKISLEGREYLCLATAEEPISICFAEFAVIDGKPQVRIIGDHETKAKLAKILQDKILADKTS